ncbi:MAG TPA: excisionase family DNA-binding protein [Noviherbaspirillum sp.]|uniref:helix-turn-helix domain-containing protein n=1 Tax=Noviherbaspirillum sp. TaxID=1926288 RepID=UPI002B45FA11|nr:excisionase family DNA-binding protein [Noviherbaspirillum sp.]HJV84133.1 excisionase family DNA-binding protein [Noviherbaspirillum sp.]
MKSTPIPDGEVCTTQEAAKLLGISVTSVQQLVEAGAIKAWKTKGGHRRIPRNAVLAYKAKAGHVQDSPEARTKTPDDLTRILVVEDNELQRGIYQKQISSWDLNAEVRYCSNGYQALMEIAGHRPDVVLADIMMDGIDGYEMINTVLAYPDLADLNIAILSGMPSDALTARGGIPKGVVFFGKPINYDELRGYLRACCAQKARRNQTNRG